MLLLELALSNIRGIKQLIRLKLKPGLNFIQGNNGSGKTTLCDILIALFSPDPQSSGFDQGQAGFILQARNGRVYRLVRDFARGKLNLAQRDETNRYIPVGYSEDQVHQFLTEEVGGLTSSELETAFNLRRPSMPSSFHSVQTVPVSSPESLQQTVSLQQTISVQAEATRVSRQDKQRRLSEITEILSRADVMVKMEDQVADLQSCIKDLKQKMRIFQEKSDALRTIGQDPALEELWPLPEDLITLLAQYEQQVAILGAQIQDIDEEKLQIQVERDQISTKPVYLNPSFISGAAVLFLSFALPQFILLPQIIMKLLFIPLLLGLGAIGVSVFKDFRRISMRKNLGAQIEGLDLQQESTEAEFRVKTEPVRDLLKKAHCHNVAELRSKLREYEQTLTLRQEFQKERDRVLNGKTPEEIEHEVQDLSRRIEEAEEKMRNNAELPTDIFSLEQEMRQINSELSETLVASDEPPDGSLFREPDEPQKVEVSSAPPLSTSINRILSTEKIRLSLLERKDRLKKDIQNSFEKFPLLKSLQIDFNDDFSPVLSFGDGRPFNEGGVHSSLLDQIYYIFFITAATSLSEAHPFPVLLDDPLISFDSSNQPIALNILRELCGKKQVLFMSHQLPPTHGEDVSITLPPPAV